MSPYPYREKAEIVDETPALVALHIIVFAGWRAVVAAERGLGGVRYP